MIWILTHPKCVLPGLSSTNISPKKRKSCEDFSTSIRNYMVGALKRLANPCIVRDKFSVFGEMISEELKCFSPRQLVGENIAYP